MKSVLSIMMILFAIAIFFVLKLPPRHVSLKDLSPAMLPAERNSYLAKKSVTDGSEGEFVTFYIIVESFKNLAIAQEKAEKLRKEFNNDFIILPQTKDGYFRICCGKYSTLQEAKSSIEILKKKIRPDVWIFSTEK